LISEGAPLEEIILGDPYSPRKEGKRPCHAACDRGEDFPVGRCGQKSRACQALAEVTGKKIEVLKEPQLIGALGAALSVL
jgi:activator of 2-hydroxyglutaryl-CoA dehydratase